MTKDKALKLAREALEGFIPYLQLKDETQCNRYNKAITAIKEALAQPPLPDAFADLIRADEREAIAQMFEDAPALVPFAQNDKGGCMICGFTPQLAMEAIRARGNT